MSRISHLFTDLYSLSPYVQQRLSLVDENAARYTHCMKSGILFSKQHCKLTWMFRLTTVHSNLQGVDVGFAWQLTPLPLVQGRLSHVNENVVSRTNANQAVGEFLLNTGPMDTFFLKSNFILRKSLVLIDKAESYYTLKLQFSFVSKYARKEDTENSKMYFNNLL